MYLLTILSAFASTPDGLTPAVEDVCDDYSGAAYGSCVAYCEATDCDEDPNASEQACDRLYERFESLTGEAPPCEITEYQVRVIYSGDDSLTASLDGVPFASASSDIYWSQETVRDLTLTSGTYTLAWHTWDTGRGYVGLGFAIEVDGQLWATADELDAVITGTNPGAGWDAPGFDDSSWATPSVCTAHPWNSATLANLTASGTSWIWTSDYCRPYSGTDTQTWTRYELVLP